MNSTFNEATISQLPAMKLLHNLGWEYISKEQVRQHREGNTNFLLLDILKQQLSLINGNQFSEQDIDTGIREFKPTQGGLLASNIGIYRLLSNGTNIAKVSTSGDSGYKPFNYIDWDNLANNRFHFTCEFEASERRNHIRLDLVLFINGIPIAGIETKAGDVPINEATEQMHRYQDEVPGLFAFIQMLAVINSGEGKYASVGTGKSSWFHWREESDENLGFSEEYITGMLDKEVPKGLLITMAKDLYQDTNISNANETKGVADSKQNKFLISLFSKERFLDLLRNFTIVGEGSKKIAIGHQYFVVKNTIARVQEKEERGEERRQGGIVWHTQGSGKSTSMILLIKNLKRHLGRHNPRIVLVSDRLELNDQMKNNLEESNVQYKLAKTGKELQQEIIDGNSSVILTNVHKFNLALVDKETKDKANLSKDIFLLADECHRTQYGNYARDMRRLLPNGCYIGFTGTPLLEKYKKSTFLTFGSFIPPTYPIRRALEDKTVVPLYYEARQFNIDIDAVGIDKATIEITKELNSVEEKAIKRKFSNAFTIRQLQSIVHKIAGDIAQHYKSYISRYPNRKDEIKAQLVVASKAHAVLYHQALNQYEVSNSVVISPPGQDSDEEKNNTINRKESIKLVQKFWQEEVIKDGNKEKDYERNTIKRFKEGAEPQILVVVDKLITGFDAPKNTILYLCKSLRDHTLLQAIARVNRIYPGKERGLIVDYNMTFPALKEALNAYDELSGYSAEDIDMTLTNVEELLNDFGDAYQKIKDILNLQDNISSEEQWLRATNAMMNSKKWLQFRDQYKTVTELFAILASLNAFNQKYRGQFEEMDQYIIFGARLNRHLTRMHYPKSSEYIIAEDLMATALSEQVTADGFRPLGKSIEIYGWGNESIEQDEHNVEEERESYDTGTKTSTKSTNNEKQTGDLGDIGKLTGDNAFTRTCTGLIRLNNEVISITDAHPELTMAMSALIKKALKECKQLALEYEQETISIKELQRKGEEWEHTKLQKLTEQLKSKKALDIPECLEKEKEAIEYYYVVKNLLQKEQVDYKKLEEELCALAKNSYELLEGPDRQGWWDNIDAEKKIKYNAQEIIWTAEDKHESFPKEKDEEIVEKMLEIARARAKIEYQRETNDFYS